MKKLYKYYLNQPVYARLLSLFIFSIGALFLVIKISDAYHYSQLNEKERCFAKATNGISKLNCELKYN